MERRASRPTNFLGSLGFVQSASAGEAAAGSGHPWWSEGGCVLTSLASAGLPISRFPDFGEVVAQADEARLGGLLGGGAAQANFSSIRAGNFPWARRNKTRIHFFLKMKQISLLLIFPSNPEGSMLFGETYSPDPSETHNWTGQDRTRPGRPGQNRAGQGSTRAPLGSYIYIHI